MEFKNTYKLWCHYEKDNWELNGYRMIYEIKNDKSFWELYNNWDILTITASYHPSCLIKIKPC